jgi:protein TonB
MDINKIQSADILDILFDGRNKEYGAYQLRKTYNRRIRNSMIGMTLICALFLVGSFIANNKKKKQMRSWWKMNLEKLTRG